jgi:hypothetical protein
LNEITKINRASGEIMWRLGGKNNQFNFTNDPDMFCRQHHIQELDNGNITIYDNGSCHSPKITMVKEYKLDTLNKTAELVWSYHHPDNMYCSTMGNAQRLDNGNTFINWGLIESPTFPSITEVRPDGTIAFELNFGNQFQLLYRSFRFVWENNSQTAIEKIDFKSVDFKIYPNPASENLSILIPENIVPGTILSIIDLNGNVVYKRILTTSPQNNEVIVHISNFTEGIYFLMLANGKYSKTKKFIK